MSKVFGTKLTAQEYQNRFGGTMLHAEEVVYFFQELIQQEIYRGVPMNFPMIGKFVPFMRKARKARNPKTGAPAEVLASYTVKFRPSAKMKEWLNKNR